LRQTLLKKQTAPKAEEAAQKNKIPEESEEIKNNGSGINSV
jgi:hypothetical protein